jgi:hypothetical protein
VHVAVVVDRDEQAYVVVDELVQAAQGEAEFGQPAPGDPLVGDGADLRHDRRRRAAESAPLGPHTELAGAVEGGPHVLPRLAGEPEVGQRQHHLLGDLQVTPAQSWMVGSSSAPTL